MSGDSVKLKFINPDKCSKKNKTETLLFWPASNIPDDAKFSLDTSSKTNKVSISAQSFVNFCSSEAVSDDVNYFIATLEHGGKLVCHPTQMYRMFPNYELKDATTATDSNETNRLTKREQLDEMKEKFGSRRSQRDLASKRKYEIQFGEDDIDNLPTIQQGEKEDGENQTEIGGENTNDSEPKILSAILPPRNSDAKSVEEVYLLSDIILDYEEATITEMEEQLFGAIKSEYIKNLASRSEDHKMRLIAIYADLLLQLVKLSTFQMRKTDPLPLVEGEIKKHLFERYTSTAHNSSRSLRYVITDQNKDRIFVYIFLLIIMLNHYKPIELDKLQAQCKIPINNIRRMLELIGCYIENLRSSAGITVKVARLKLPLNVFKEAKKKFRR